MFLAIPAKIEGKIWVHPSFSRPHSWVLHIIELPNQSGTIPNNFNEATRGCIELDVSSGSGGIRPDLVL